MHIMLSKIKIIAVKIFMLSLFHLKILKILNPIFNNYYLSRKYNRGIVFPYIRKRIARNVQILTYHRVNDDNDPFFTGTPIGTFEKHMKYLSNNFSVISLESVVESMQSNDVPHNAIAVTFDDGYKDVYLNAYPILKKFSIPATVFLATSCIDSKDILWHDRVFSAFRETQESFLVAYGPYTQTYSLGSVTERLRAQQDVLRFLRTLDSDERIQWLECLTAMLLPEVSQSCSEMMLTWEDIKVMYTNNITFGSHTVTHPIMSKISHDQAMWEICESKSIIEQRLGSPVRTFAYPNGKAGDFDHTTKALLQEAGYICAVTTIFGANECGHDLFALHRGQPWEADLPSFATKMSWYKFVHSS